VRLAEIVRRSTSRPCDCVVVRHSTPPPRGSLLPTNRPCNQRLRNA
jgi:hypothetical protein